jgi:hypothetical protein
MSWYYDWWCFTHGCWRRIDKSRHEIRYICPQCEAVAKRHEQASAAIAKAKEQS